MRLGVGVFRFHCAGDQADCADGHGAPGLLGSWRSPGGGDVGAPQQGHARQVLHVPGVESVRGALQSSQAALVVVVVDVVIVVVVIAVVAVAVAAAAVVAVAIGVAVVGVAVVAVVVVAVVAYVCSVC